MTGLLSIAYLFKWQQNFLLFNTLLALVAIIGEIPLFLRATSALKFKLVSIELLVTIAVIGAFFIQEFSEAGIVVWLFSLGNLLEELSLQKTRQSVKELVQLAPKAAYRIVSPEDRKGELVAIDDLDEDDYVLVRTGDQIPVDGEVVRGSGYVDEAPITGEAKPQAKKIGNSTYAGTNLTDGTLVVQASRVGEDTTFGQLIELIEEAQDSQTQAQRKIDQFAKYYTPIVLVIALIVFITSRQIELAITVLVLGCPGALVIGVPVSTVAGIGTAAKSGILVKGATVFETFRKVNWLAFDKTGTITSGHPAVTKVVNLAGDEKLNTQYLVSVETEATHPLAKAIVHHFASATPFPTEQFTTVKGAGIKAMIAGHHVLVGNEELIQAAGITNLPTLTPTTTHVLMAVDNQLTLALEIMDPLKETTPAAIKQLQSHYHLALLTGDHQAVAEATVAGLDFNAIHGDQLPKDKVNFIQATQDKGQKVAFIGDGINDGPALATAKVGIAMGSGSDTAIETADIVLPTSDLSRLPILNRIAKATMWNMNENISIALLTVLLLFIGLFTGYIHMASGMLIHEASILVVILNSFRLLRHFWSTSRFFISFNLIIVKKVNGGIIMQKITMAVDQLTCPSCLTKIQTALDQQTTVTSSKVLFNAGKVKLTATDDANPNEFKKIVEQLGYPVTNLKVKELA